MQQQIVKSFAIKLSNKMLWATDECRICAILNKIHFEKLNNFLGECRLLQKINQICDNVRWCSSYFDIFVNFSAIVK